MEIVGDFYKLCPVGDNSKFFDLELLYDIRGTNPRKEFKNSGYGYTLEGAINAIIMYSLSKKYDTITLKEFLDAYKETWKDIKSTLNISLK